jgi:RNA polymerase sigma-70 factor (ECF subfamily)
MADENKTPLDAVVSAGGDQADLDRLVPLVYEELRRLAKRQMRRERPDALLQTTALVHEAYLRLADNKDVRWQSREHFLAVAAQVMRHILVDFARSRLRSKRGSGISDVPLHDTAVMSTSRAEELVAVHRALEGLATVDARKGRVFELRYFGGMSVEETAGALAVSPATVARDWRMAKAWLRREIREGRPHGS